MNRCDKRLFDNGIIGYLQKDTRVLVRTYYLFTENDNNEIHTVWYSTKFYVENSTVFKCQIDLLCYGTVPVTVIVPVRYQIERLIFVRVKIVIIK